MHCVVCFAACVVFFATRRKNCRESQKTATQVTLGGLAKVDVRIERVGGSGWESDSWAQIVAAFFAAE